MSAPPTNPRPDLSEIEAVAAKYIGHRDFSVRRFPNGLCHYVYEVIPATDRPFVVRMGHAETKADLAGCVFWHDRLRPMGVPLPRILHADLSLPFPFLILERIPGSDLGDVYRTLTRTAKQSIINDLTRFQAVVRQLPPATGYGFGFSYDDPRLRATWEDVLADAVARARQWISQVGVCDVRHVDRVEQALRKYASYFPSVQPLPFLHDTTTKNVLIYESKLSGIVDVDDLCFGDPLFVVALTKMALLSARLSTDYVDYWCEQLALTRVQHEVVNLYTALFCVTFMGEIGQAFNKSETTVDLETIRLYEGLLDALL